MKITAGPWAGYEVTVRDIDNHVLPEYHHPSSDPGQHRFFAYVEVVPGTRFFVCLTRPMSPTAVAITLHADGDKILAGIIPAYKRTSSVDGYNKVTGDDNCWKVLTFGKMNAESSRPFTAETKVEELGTITAFLERGWCHTTRQMAMGLTPKLAFQGRHEMGLHTFVTGEITGPGHQLHVSNFTPTKVAPTATICFVYRTALALRTLNVIPSASTDVDLVDEGDKAEVQHEEVRTFASSPAAIEEVKPLKEVRKVIEVWETVEGDAPRLVQRHSVTVFDLTEDS